MYTQGMGDLYSGRITVAEEGMVLTL